MNLENKNIGFIITGAFKSINCSIDEIENASKIKNVHIYPIMSYTVFNGISKDKVIRIKEITRNRIIHNMEKINLDIGVIVPCTGNTLAKLANNIIDTPALYIANYILTSNKPLVIGISSFNEISSSFINIGKLMSRKNIYFIPFRQTNPITRPNYIMFDPKLIIKTLNSSLEGVQIEPILM